MDNNIYYSPEAFGFKKFLELEDQNASYSFDTFCVWMRLTDGALFWDKDSGCSCPSPFENTTVESLNAIDKDRLDEFGKALREYNQPYGPDSIRVPETELLEAEKKVRKHFRMPYHAPNEDAKPTPKLR